jgi:hypothetical protein
MFITVGGPKSYHLFPATGFRRFKRGETNDEVKSYEHIRFIDFPSGTDFGNRNVRPGSVPNPGQGRRQGRGEIHEHPLRTIVAKETSTTTAAFATRTKGNTVSEERSKDAHRVYQQSGTPYRQQNVRLRIDSIVPAGQRHTPVASDSTRPAAIGVDLSPGRTVCRGQNRDRALNLPFILPISNGEQAAQYDAT